MKPNSLMKILSKILPLLLTVAFILQLTIVTAQASRSLAPYSQGTTPRPTVPKPTKPPPTEGSRPYRYPTAVEIGTIPGPTPTPTITPTPTQTMDLSLNNFLSSTFTTQTPTNTPTPFVDRTPTQSAITATFVVTDSASLLNVTPIASTSGTITKGVIIPFATIVVLLVGILGIRGLSRKFH